ncbi:DUF2799 domain-containing protein [Enterovibrio paralichthyis]|uniref:DUF2799 domain-containing protein n=1 Tax=Enterovibrio paralichthyis TaxID=2853805 RepID=UPI002101DE24|nr:DUF2799 domain-containing protein [Enterovibrio paralichthyis]
MLASLVMLLMVGCAAVQNAESLVKEGKWQAVGEQDGVRGLPSRSMTDLEELAQRAGVDNVDVNEYEAGYNEGIDRYCDVGNAYDIGLSGMQYLGVCSYLPDGLRFQMEWQRGFEDFQSADQTF